MFVQELFLIILQGLHFSSHNVNFLLYTELPLRMSLARTSTRECNPAPGLPLTNVTRPDFGQLALANAASLFHAHGTFTYACHRSRSQDAQDPKQYLAIKESLHSQYLTMFVQILSLRILQGLTF